MKRLLISLILFVMLPAIAMATEYEGPPIPWSIDECEGTSSSCGLEQCENCNSFDGYYGDFYCKYDDVYRIYRNYYCESNEEGCSYSEEERKIEDCEYCEDGQCVVCDTVKCDENDGYYDGRICIHDDVYKTYRDYYCSYGECVYTETYRKIEDCDYRCEHGECIIECPNQCIDNAWFYDGVFSGEICHYSMKDCDDYDREYGRFCKSGDVYARLKNYYCTKNGCEYSTEEKKIEDCDEECLGWSSWYRMDGFMERTRTCYSYSCINGGCVKIREYEVISRKELLPTAQFVEKEKSFEFPVDVSHSLVKKTLSSPEKRLYNGLLFGSDEIVIEFPESYVKYLTFSVEETNLYAPLVIYLNDEVIYSEFTGKGNYAIRINRTVSGVLRIKADSSGWRIWAPAIYHLKNIDLFTESFAMNRNEFDFSLEKELENFKAARIVEWPDNTNIILNGNYFSGVAVEKDYLKEGKNIIIFEPFFNSSSEGIAKLNIWYDEEIVL